MVIYGVALLAICTVAGLYIGDLLGRLIGVSANVGGVGIAMLLLVAAVSWSKKQGGLGQETRQGVGFWSAMYIPIVVAMAAQQNVFAAIGGGLVALVAGAGATIVCLLLVPAISRIGLKGGDAAAPLPTDSRG